MDSGGEAAAAAEAPAEAVASDFVAEERAKRLAKQERLTARTGAAYRFDRDHALAQIRDEFGGLEAAGEGDTAVRVAGRLMLIRRHGGLVFADLEDQTATLQLVFARDTLDPAAFGDLPTSIAATGSAWRAPRCAPGWASSRSGCAIGRC